MSAAERVGSAASATASRFGERVAPDLLLPSPAPVPYWVKGNADDLDLGCLSNLNEAGLIVWQERLDIEGGIARHYAHEFLASRDHLAHCGDCRSLDDPFCGTRQGHRIEDDLHLMQTVR